MTRPVLPEGYITRPATLDDVDVILALLNKLSLALVGEAEDTAEEIFEELSDPNFDIATRTLLIFDAAGNLLAYGNLYDYLRLETPIADVYVDIETPGGAAPLEAYLLAWVDDICAANMPHIPPEHRVAIRAWSYSHDDGYNGSLERAGYVNKRVSYQMRLELPVEPLTAPALPDGFTLGIMPEGEDWTPLIHTILDTWQDHYGFIKRPDEVAIPMWQRYLEHNFDPRSWLLVMHGDEIAAFALCKLNHADYPDFAYVNLLGTARKYRRRGLAEALLRTVFAHMQRLGMRRVGLGVDGESLTGATRLYERAGMHVHQAYRMNEKLLRDGIETTVTELTV